MHEAGGQSVYFVYTWVYPLVLTTVTCRLWSLTVISAAANVGDEYLGKGPLGAWRDAYSHCRSAVLFIAIAILSRWNAAVKEKREFILAGIFR